jgi:hypothetical protein
MNDIYNKNYKDAYNLVQDLVLVEKLNTKIESVREELMKVLKKYI